MPAVDYGYACLSVLVKDCSPAHTVTLGRLAQLPDDQVRRDLLGRVLAANLDATRRLLWHNIAHGIRLYRFSSLLVPLSTHPATKGWAWQQDFAAELAAIGAQVQRHGLRVSTHPGQYTVLNSPTAAVTARAVDDLCYHDRLLAAMGLDAHARMVLHVGGAQGGKKAALSRFRSHFAGLPESVRRRIVLENDDTLYSADMVLDLCLELGCPMVLDIHHAAVLPGAAELGRLWPAIVATWPAAERPKVHVSSPASPQKPRAHADFVDPVAFASFCSLAGAAEFDVMVEAKQKDAALLRLWQDIGHRPQPLTEA